MSNPTVVNNLPRFSKNLEHTLNAGLAELATDILVTARAVTPYKDGALRRESDIFKKVSLHWQVRYHMEYAYRQEIGKGIRNYTTAGTGKEYLSKTGDRLYAKAIGTLKKHAQRTKV